MELSCPINDSAVDHLHFPVAALASFYSETISARHSRTTVRWVYATYHTQARGTVAHASIGLASSSGRDLCDVRLSHIKEEGISYGSKAKAGEGEDGEECETHGDGSLRREVLKMVQGSCCVIIFPEE
jgi:hypothetical protein